MRYKPFKVAEITDRVVSAFEAEGKIYVATEHAVYLLIAQQDARTAEQREADDKKIADYLAGLGRS